MKIDDVSVEEHPEYFADFDDSTIRYISENIDNISDEELQEIIEKELSKYH
ncbi:hypothetical protein [Methanobrevibacter sp.]|jgi:hypothetical protein|uniref:hypothetical protein n=1 Tax=Methanobrevibacter sp. TaxID=66852 RepID=UPI0038683B44